MGHLAVGLPRPQARLGASILWGARPGASWPGGRVTSPSARGWQLDEINKPGRLQLLSRRPGLPLSPDRLPHPLPVSVLGPVPQAVPLAE